MVKGCRSQWPYLALGAVIGALVIYSRRSREIAQETDSWHGIDDRTPIARHDFPPAHAAKLKGVDLRYADLRCSNLTNAELEAATILPNDEHWSADADLSRFTNSQDPFFLAIPCL